ncbi:hypothetical protein AB1399_00965 [Hydrogenibacillus schlegelii]|uniref:Uncharacterized protein n=1 Tax=Hydrogenibacillus schlegelii TaxID=1484 RepID=A0A132N7S7_HYDSH|nr:hypothetical protein [Hydrogenibacillus schlegelii]KWX06174.1 hypothetical protein TR75_06800 [Hydrogenibacillus schlegelii]OAR04651.1 hypothetical protein SA87_08955 [Hydrogenibacillus schlegelii]
MSEVNAGVTVPERSDARRGRPERVRWAVVRALAKAWTIAYWTGRLGLRTEHRPSRPLKAWQARLRSIGLGSITALGLVVTPLLFGWMMLGYSYALVSAEAAYQGDSLAEALRTGGMIIISLVLMITWFIWNYALLFIANPSRLMQYGLYPVTAREMSLARLMFAFTWWGWLSAAYFAGPLASVFFLGARWSPLPYLPFVIAWVGLSLLTGSYTMYYDLTAMKKNYNRHLFLTIFLFLIVFVLLDKAVESLFFTGRPVGDFGALATLIKAVVYGSGHPWLSALTFLFLGVGAQSLAALRAGRTLSRIDFL